jgi:nucleoside-diphosphate-sugar epimerase
MRVVVTGAAGKLAARLCPVLIEAGHEVVALDRRPVGVFPGRPATAPAPAAADLTPLPVPLHIVNLLDFAAVRPLFDGAQAVVHMGNHSSYRDPPGHVIFIENVTMNHNVFQAAHEARAATIIFASSVQAIARYHPPHEEAGRCNLAYLPIDADIPACAANPYGLSKQVGETMLAYYARQHGIAGVALRYPALLPDEQLPRVPRWAVGPTLNEAEEGCGWLSFQDAARLIESILRAKLPGFRIYHPAAPEPLCRQTADELLRTVYANVPLRRPAEEITSLIDISRISEETGWTPQATRPPTAGM